MSSEPAVGERGSERSKGLIPDMTDALDTRARQLILCLSAGTCVFIRQHCVFVAAAEKNQLAKAGPLCFRITKKGNIVSSIWTVSF